MNSCLHKAILSFGFWNFLEFLNILVDPCRSRGSTISKMSPVFISLPFSFTTCPLLKISLPPTPWLQWLEIFYLLPVRLYAWARLSWPQPHRGICLLLTVATLPSAGTHCPFFWCVFPQHPSFPTDVQCYVSMQNLQCHMSALYRFETKGWVKHSETYYLKKGDSVFYILLQVLIFIINYTMLLHLFKYMLNIKNWEVVFLILVKAAAIQMLN